MKRSILSPALYRTAKFLCYWIFRLVWRLRVVGTENIPPDGAIIFAANHRSLIDPPLLGSATHHYVNFLAKEELFRFRPFGWLIFNLHAHPLNRRGGDVAAFKMAKRVLGNGQALIVFPEGRRSKTDELGPARAGVGLLAQMAKCPVIPTYLHNSAYLKQLKPLTIAFGSSIWAEPDESAQSVADRVMAAIAELQRRTVEKI
jgi:1-acyl-sn-glycerol-3-phosphate acyltransferase